MPLDASGGSSRVCGTSQKYLRACRACAVARARTASRSPEKRKRSVALRPDAWTVTKTSPTGFSGVPPAGPAIPVTAIEASAPSSARAPRAIASAASAETAPWCSSTSAGTPSCRILSWLE